MITSLFYPVYLAIAFGFTLIFIPKKNYKEYFIYGILIGGLGDMLVVGMWQNILHVMWFKNQGIFNVLGHNILSPPSWTCTVMIFLYFLPRRRLFLYLYILTFGLFSLGYGYMVRNADLFAFKPWLYPYVALLNFLAWWSFAAWVFLKTSPLGKATQGQSRT